MQTKPNAPEETPSADLFVFDISKDAFKDDNASAPFSLQLLRSLSRNTDVEWSYAENEKGMCWLATSHKQGEEPYMGKIVSVRCHLIRVIHTHGKNEAPFASDNIDKDTRRRTGDSLLRDAVSSKNPGCIWGIMQNGVLYDYQGFSISWSGERKMR